MKYFRITHIWFLIVLILGCTDLAHAQNQIPNDFEYISPSPFSKYGTLQQVISFRFSKTNLHAGIKDVQVFVKGNISGKSSGDLKLTDDHKTYIFKTLKPFVSNETIEVTIISPEYISFGSFQFQFSIGSLNDSKREQIASKVLKKRFPKLIQDQLYTPHVENIETNIKNELPDGFPEIAVTYQNNPSPGYIFIAPLSNATGALFNIILDHNGTPVYYKKTTNGSSDFKVQPSGDITYYDLASGKYYKMNSLYEIEDTISVSNGYYSDMHELRMLENGHSLLMGIDPQLVNMDTVVPGGHPQAVVVGLIIQELNTSKEVVFQWRSWDHFQITDASDYVNLTDSLIDYVHGNSIEIVSDTNLLLSCRNMNEVTNINRNTGEVIWRLGGKNNMFEMINFTDTFCMQHSIRLMPDSVNLSLFDNGNFHSPEPFSSAVEYKINETTMTIEMVDRIQNEPDIFSEFMGHAQRLKNGNTIIGWGYGVPSVSEFDTANNKLLEVSFPYANYRAFKFDWKTSVFETNVDDLNFGNISSQDSSLQMIEISNNCNYPIEINKFLTQSDVFTPLESLPINILANETKSISIKFKADENGVYNDMLTLCWDIETDTLVQRIARQINLSGSVGNQGFSNDHSRVNFYVFPIPFKEKVHIQSVDQLIKQVSIYDNTGKLVEKINNIHSKNIVIFLNNPTGIYFLKGIMIGGEVFSAKILKQ